MKIMSYFFHFVLIGLVAGIVGCKTADERGATTEEINPLVNMPFKLTSVPTINNAIASKKYSELKQKYELSLEAATPESLFELVRAARMAGRPSAEMYKHAQHLMIKTQNADPGVYSELIAKVDIEIALQAIFEKKYALADYHLDRSSSSFVPETKAEIAVARGVLRYLLQNLDGAAVAWSEAIKIDPLNKAASINLAFLALRTGDGAKARKLLEPHSADWFASSGLISAYRLQRQPKLVDAACDKVLTDQPKHLPTLINCAIFQVQSRTDFVKANVLLDRAIAASDRADVSEYAFLLKQRYANQEKSSASKKR